MRIRKKPWARIELEECGFYIYNPEQYKGDWKNTFKKVQPIYMELGCGKGDFISNIAFNNPNINYIAIDLIDSMLGLAKRKIQEKYENRDVDNLLLVRYDIERISEILNKDDKIDRIYINFCNPWPRGKHHKKRLTSEKQLNQYKVFLNKGSEIFFKTDDDYLFEDSLKYFINCGFNIIKKTYDLENETNFWNGDENIETEHERMFKDNGIKIKALIAKI